MNFKSLVFGDKHDNNEPKHCPHADCGQVIDEFVVKKGILFCPHCQKSILLEPVLSLIQLEQERLKPKTPFIKTLSFEWQIFRPKYFALVFLLMLIIIILNLPAIKDLKLTQTLWILGYLVFIGYDVYRQKKSKFTVNNIDKPLIQGVDNLQQVKKHYTNFIAPTGELQPVMMRRVTQTQGNYQKIIGCPHCTSQQLDSVSQLLNLNLNFYENFGIKKPAQLPQQFYDKATHTYADENPLAKSLLICLNCHSHYQWQKYKMPFLRQFLHFILLLVVGIVFMASIFGLGFGFNIMLDWLQSDLQQIFSDIHSLNWLFILIFIGKLILMDISVLICGFLFGFLGKVIRYFEFDSSQFYITAFDIRDDHKKD